MLFADDTSILITSHNDIQFQSDLNIVLGQLNEWFKANLLSLNFDKTYFIQFTNIIYYIIFIHLPLDLYRYGNSHSNT